MIAYVPAELDFFNVFFIKVMNLYFSKYFQFVLQTSSHFLVVMVTLLIVSFFARESIKFINKI